MKAIIIQDSDSRALLNKLKLESFRMDSPSYGIAQSEAWASLSESMRKQIVSDMHSRFHYIVCTWLSEQGAAVT